LLFDSIVLFAKNIVDSSLILEFTSGKYDYDSTSFDAEVPEYSKNLLTEQKFKIGLPKEYFGEGLSEEIKNASDSLVKELSAKGFQIIDISLPHSEYTIATYYILTTAEASSNLARYDGTKYGYRSNDSSTLIDMYKSSRSEGFGAEVKRRIMLGTYVLSAGYYDAYYLKAQKVRRLIKNDCDKAFKKVDLILTPTTPTTAFKLGEKSDDPLEMYLSDIYTTSANLAGIPGISFPYSKDSKGLPIGLQFLSNQFDEEKLLQMDYYIQEKFLKNSF